MTSAFDRTRRWLADFGDPDLLVAALAGTHVEFVVEAPRPDAEISAALAASMLLRLDRAAPILHVVAPRTRARHLPRLADLPLAEALALEHRGFDSVTRLSATPASDAVIRIRFGTRSPDALSVTSNGWQVAIGDPPLPGDGNPIAAAYAGVLASVEAIKAMLTPVGLNDRQLRPWTGTISLWDYEHPGDRPQNPCLAEPRRHRVRRLRRDRIGDRLDPLPARSRGRTERDRRRRLRQHEPQSTPHGRPR
jgi:hypothetical protein